jgi:hypothetical protein
VTSDAIQLRKQLHGLALADSLFEHNHRKNVGMIASTEKKKESEFQSRSNANMSPLEQDVFEAIIRGIMKRKELGLYQNEITLLSELQLLLDETLKIYALSTKRDVILGVF